MTRKFAPIIYFIICALEGLWVLSVFIRPSVASGIQSAFELSPLRLGLVLTICLLVAIFFILAALEWRAKSDKLSPVSKVLTHRYILLLASFLFMAGLAVAYIFLFSPLRLERLYGYYLRFKPFFIWGILVVLQFYLLSLLLLGTAYWKGAWDDFTREPRVIKIRRGLNSPAGGLVFLVLSFLFGLTKLYYGRFVDEADNITTGWLISEGYTLYRDVFSHHFPFPYYWVAMVVGLFGNSFIAIRISVLLLQIGLFAVSMRITGFYLAIGLTSLVWNLINQFHRGQEAIYATFEGILMVVVFLVIFYLLTKRVAVGKATLIFLGILLALALLTDPLMVYAAVIAIAALFVSGVKYRSQSRYREGVRRVLWVGISAGLVLGIFAVSLFASGTAQIFYHDTIWFNAEVYTKYVDAQPLRVDRILQNTITGLNILNKRWFAELSPFMPMETYRSVKLENETMYFSWVFASFLFRLSILACAIGLVLNRKTAAGIFLLLYSAALLVREDDGLYAIGFTLVSLFAAFYLLVELRRPARLDELRRRQRIPQKFTGQSAWILWIALSVLIGVMQFWSAFRGGYFIADHWGAIMNKRHVTMYNKVGDDIRELACDQEDLEISVFPINPIVYFVTGIPPASRYTFMYPWVAEVGQQELIAELRENPSAVVTINTNRKAGSPDGPAAYMADTIEFLNEAYVVIGEDYWMSPELAELCSFDPRRTPFIEDDESG
ncbi:MAG: hypothetical protein KAS36_01775 [Anaerolineales bacterium]|nr:hypothetical protein [Anaerolineales bacterium]